MATHHLALAHGYAVQAFRAAGTAGRIGPALNLAPAYPAEPDADEAVVLADGFENRLYLDPVFKGAYPTDVPTAMGPASRSALAAAIKADDLAVVSEPVDLLGVNYYNPVYVDARGGYVTMKPTSIASWEQIYPEGLTDVLVRLKRDYTDKPLVITENGIPNAGNVTPVDGTVDDPERIAYMRDHLVAAWKAIAAGVNLEGYHVWSLLDNFEWAQGFTQRWGIVHVDFDSQERTPKKSAHWYREVIARNAI